ncbi:MAG: hypothetical protein PF440_05475 [Thiomicrorhabdus sp.]|jgi:hypothetical protein|nr:hypothetical protein [Thiomicrorhabdus sp.]
MFKVLGSWKFKKGIIAFNIEQAILKRYVQYRYKGIPILKKGNTELFIKNILNLHNQEEQE